jgi:hypothetical protein
MAGATDKGWWSEDDPIYQDGWTIHFGPLLNSDSLKPKQPEPKPEPETLVRDRTEDSQG